MAVVLFLGGITTFVAWRMGVFESSPTPNHSEEKEPIINDDLTKEATVDTTFLPEKTIQETTSPKIPETPSEREFHIMSSSKSMQVSEPFSIEKVPYRDQVTDEFLRKRTRKVTTMPGSKSGPVFELGDFSSEKKSLHPYLDSVTKADSLKKTPMMGGSKSLIISYPLEIKQEVKK